MAKAKPKTYPNQTFEKDARAAGASVRLMWEIPGPDDTMVAWLSCYAVNDGLAIVQTYTDGNGWEVFTPAGTVLVDASVADALRRCTVNPA